MFVPRNFLFYLKRPFQLKQLFNSCVTSINCKTTINVSFKLEYITKKLHTYPIPVSWEKAEETNSCSTRKWSRLEERKSSRLLAASLSFLQVDWPGHWLNFQMPTIHSSSGQAIIILSEIPDNPLNLPFSWEEYPVLLSYILLFYDTTSLSFALSLFNNL